MQCALHHPITWARLVRGVTTTRNISYLNKFGHIPSQGLRHPIDLIPGPNFILPRDTLHSVDMARNIVTCQKAIVRPVDYDADGCPRNGGRNLSLGSRRGPTSFDYFFNAARASMSELQNVKP